MRDGGVLHCAPRGYNRAVCLAVASACSRPLTLSLSRGRWDREYFKRLVEKGKQRDYAG